MTTTTARTAAISFKRLQKNISVLEIRNFYTVGTIERPDDVIVTSRPPDQWYFWSPEWQEGEKRASEDIEDGRIKWLEEQSTLDAHFLSLTKPRRRSRKKKTGQ